MNSSVIDPNGLFEQFRERTERAISGIFPIIGQKRTLELEGFKLGVNPSPRDVKAQLQAKLNDQTWGAPLAAKLVLRDTATGKVLQRQEVPVAMIPKMTAMRGFIVDGKEYYADYLWQTKPGVYVDRKKRGIIATVTGAPKRHELEFDPSSRQFKLRVGSSSVPLVPVLNTLGITSDKIAKTWGQEIFKANQVTSGRAQTAFTKLQKALGKPIADNPLQLREALEEITLDPNVTKKTLGKEFKKLTPDALLATTEKMLAVSRGKVEPDDRDSLRHKELIGIDDQIEDRLKTYTKNKLRSFKSAVDRHEVIDRIVQPFTFHSPIYNFFRRSSLSQLSEQTSPLDVLRASTRSSIAGEGTSLHALEHGESRSLNPSHLGFLDPIDTPEGSRTGVNLQLTLGVTKEGRTPKTLLYNLRKKRYEYVDPATFEDSVVAMPDQFQRAGKGWKPVKSKVKVSGPGNTFTMVPATKVDYVIPNPNLILGVGTSLVPFAGNTSPGRLEMAARHMSQAIPLVKREEPLVQVALQPGKKEPSLEEEYAKELLPTSPVSGTVTSVSSDEIKIRDARGKVHSVPLYTNYPLMGKREYLHEAPLVKRGDKVRAGQVLADSNYTKNGKLALGTNLYTALIPIPGKTFEDALVVSESAAKKLTSEHMYKFHATPFDQEIVDPKKFQAYYPAAFTRDQLNKLDQKTGVVKPGTVVKPGDPLILGLREQAFTNEAQMLKKMHRSLANPYLDASTVWDSDYEGKVVRVHRTQDGTVKVHVAVTEPLEVGDKLCYSADTEVLTRRGWLPIYQLTLDDEIATRSPDGSLVYQEPLHIDKFPHCGLMYHVRTQQLDLMVTMDHQMYVRPKGEADFRLIKAREIMGREVKYQKGASWRQPDVLYFKLPSVGMTVNSRTWSTEELELPMDPWVEFLGYFWSAGYTRQSGNDYVIVINRSRSSDPRLYRRIVEVVSELGFKVEQRLHRILFHSKQVFYWLRAFGKYSLTKIPEFIHSLSSRQIRLFLSAYQCGETAEHITVESVEMANAVQELCLKAGWAGNIQRGNTEAFPPSWTVQLVKSEITPVVNSNSSKNRNAQVEELVEYSGFVYCCEVPNHVLYVRRNGKPVFCGNTTRHGVKGVVVDIRPDHEMPKTKTGRTIELAINPHGVASRMAVGQVYEMATAKIAEKHGKPVKVPNFTPDTDYGETTRKALTKLGINDQDEVVDPTTGRTIGKALAGPSYVLKQRHQVDRKMVARAMGPGFSYDVNRQPKGGGESPGQTLGGLGNMALLAHGARSILREAHTYKVDADQADEVWRAIQVGAALPPPRLTFAHQKFGDYLKVLGVNIEKKGTRVKLVPMTDEEVVRSTKGEIKNPGLMFRASDMAPEPGGLFDPHVTGGIQGTHAARITLAERLPNPFLEKGVLAITGLSQTQLRDIIAGKAGLKDGKVVDRKEAEVVGSKAIEKMLSSIDPKTEMKELEKTIPTLSGAELDKASKRYRYLKALTEAGFKNPADAYMTKYLYVPPPTMRPVQILPSGAIIRDSINELYKGVGVINERLKNAPPELPESRKGRTRLSLYDAVGSVMGAVEPGTTAQGAEMRGALDVLAGTGPKYSWLQSKLMKARQDLSARSTIVPDPNLTIDEIGIPKPIATAVYRPFVVRELTRLGHAPLAAQEMIKRDDPVAIRALERVMEDRPLLMKRDPVLHKYGVMAFKPRIVGGRAIHIPPLITSSMGADFDGDTVSLYAPITNKSVDEARKMFPSENLLNPANGKPVFTPSNEMSVGLYRLSLFGKDTGKSYKDEIEAAKAVKEDKLQLTDVVTIGGKKTTVGRLLVWKSLPEAARDPRIIYDPDFKLTSKRIDNLLTAAALKDPTTYADAAQSLMHLGNAAVYDQLFSVSLSDFKPDRETREKYMKAADMAAARILASKDPDKEAKAISAWVEAGQKMFQEHLNKESTKKSNLWIMSEAGVKPSPMQYQQLVMAPVLMTDPKGKPILAPVDKSYSEGLDTTGFWLSSIGARTGLVRKGIEVREPGYLNKHMVATVGNQVVVSDELPREGISMDTDHPDIVGRFLVEPVKTNKVTLPRGTLITPEILDRLKNGRVGKVVVASPLTTPHGEGISSKAFGLMPDGRLPQIGENIGVMAGQSIGERLAQLMLKATHLGGVYDPSAGGAAVNQIERIKQLLRIPESIPNAAVLAPTDGKVRSIRNDPAGGWQVTVASKGQEHELYVPSNRKLTVKAGTEVKKGRPITDGNIDLRELLDIGGIDQVRKQIVNELDDIFRPLGIRRRNIEVLARGVTNTGIVEDPGDSKDLVRGQYVPLSAVREMNATELKGKKPVKVTPILTGISQAPLDSTEDWLAKLNHERVRDSLVEAALQGHVSDISGLNPFSAMAFNERFGEGISKKPGAY